MAAGITPDDVKWATDKADRLTHLAGAPDGVLGTGEVSVLQVEAVEFLRLKLGVKSAIYVQASTSLQKYGGPTATEDIAAALKAFVRMHADGQLQVPVEAQTRVVAANDLLEQVESLLGDSRVHPAAPVMLAGAALEEMLRSLVLATGATPKGKPSINSYSTALQAGGTITVQEVKDITSWAGLRNHAAHGQFAQIEIANARLMAQGINLFMQKHAP